MFHHRSASHRRINERRAQHKRYSCDLLEQRLLLANLHIVDAFLTDPSGNPQASVAVGQAYLYMQVDFQTNNLPANAQYVIRTTIGSTTYSNTINWGAGLSGTGNWSFVWGNFVIGSGAATATAKVDDTNTVVETDETDNTMTFGVTGVVPPFKFVQPLEGTPWVDWSIGNYVDLDVSSGIRDYRGGTFAYDGHNGWDIGTGNWRKADAGYEIYAAAAGTVQTAIDGNYDRNYVAQGQPANYVVINHGGGWTTQYFHLRRGSVNVINGQHVNAGDLIGLMGSSGNSTGPHLHFGVYYNGEQVEPNVASASYFITPIGYSADHPTVLDSGVTTYDPSNEFADGPSTASTILPGQTIYDWVDPAGVNAGDTFDMVWYRPDNSVFTTYSWVPGQMQGGYWYAGLTVPVGGPLGNWHVGFDINGIQKSYDTFYVQNTGAPQAHMYIHGLFGSTSYTVDGRWTPYDFGTIHQYQVAPGPTDTWELDNDGQTTLTTTGYSNPVGFTTTNALAANISAGSSDNFSIRLDDATVGHKSGLVAFLTNDIDGGEAVMTFHIEGDVLPISPLDISNFVNPTTVYFLRNGGFTDIFINTPPGPTPTYEVPIAQMANFVLDTGDDDDQITVDYSAGDPLTTGGLTVNGGSGSDSVTVIGDAAGNTFTFGPNKNIIIGSDTIHITNVEIVNLDGAGGTDTFNLGSPDIDISFSGISTVSVTGGAASDTINLDDTGDAGLDTYNVTNSTFNKTGWTGSLSYDTVESFVLNANNVSDQINIESNVATTINAGGGADDVKVSPTAQTLFNIGGGGISVSGGSGVDAIDLYDGNFGGLSNFTLTPSFINLPFNGAQVPYASVETITIFAGGGTNTITVNGTAAGSSVSVNAGGGTDTITVNETDPTSPITVLPSSGDDTISVNTDGAGSAAALFNATQRVGNLRIGTSGVATLTAGGNRVLTATNFNITGTGKLDLKDNDAILDYTGATQIATVGTLLASGFNGGAWNGTGINTSLGNAGTFALGYAEASDVAPGGIFSGQPIDATAIAIKYTYYGDASLDGQVDVSDLGRLATNWQAAARWAGGNFNYDALVDVSDLGRLATNWQAGVGSPLVRLVSSPPRPEHDLLLDASESPDNNAGLDLQDLDWTSPA